VRTITAHIAEFDLVQVTCPQLLYHRQCEIKLKGRWLPEPYDLRTLIFEVPRTRTA
jgi:hypothetical protein